MRNIKLFLNPLNGSQSPIAINVSSISYVEASGGSLLIKYGGTQRNFSYVADPITENPNAEAVAQRIAELMAASKSKRRFLPKKYKIDFLND